MENKLIDSIVPYYLQDIQIEQIKKDGFYMPFPIDMLRIMKAWPKTQEDSDAIWATLAKDVVDEKLEKPSVVNITRVVKAQFLLLHELEWEEQGWTIRTFSTPILLRKEGDAPAPKPQPVVDDDEDDDLE